MTFSFFRNVRTTQERRISEDPDHKPYVRAKRNADNLPDTYCDIIRRYNDKHSWKHHRKTQYKGL